MWYNADSSIFASAYEHRHLFDKSAPCKSRSGRPTIFLVLRYYLFYVPNPDLHITSFASAPPRDCCTRAQPETNILCILHFALNLCHMNACPPGGNQGGQRGASPRGCPSSTPTLASVPSSQLTSQLAMSSSQRQPHDQSVSHLKPVSLTLHRVLRSRVNDYRTGPRGAILVGYTGTNKPC